MIGWSIVIVLWFVALVVRFYAFTHDENWMPRPRPYYPLWTARALMLTAAFVSGAVLT